ncbi:MAG TPA: hypothetical protein VMR41_01530 [Patescibacteria group bacterium]|nr:hypothetical protein [Patescibacteria group bacterium]
MNNNEINLLPVSSNNISLVLQKRIKIVRFVALFCLFTIPSIVVIMFLLVIFSPLSSLQQEKTSLLASNTALQQKAEKIDFIENRIKLAQDFLNKREMYDGVLSELTSSLPSDLTIGSLQFTQKNVVLSISGNSLLSLKNYRESLASDVSQSKNFKSIVFHTLTTQGSVYQENLSLTIK